MLEPEIFALVTCRDCYIFMPNTQFKPRNSPLITSETNGSPSSDKGKTKCWKGVYLEMFIRSYFDLNITMTVHDFGIFFHC